MTQQELLDYNKRCAETCIFDKFIISSSNENLWNL